MAPHRFLVSFGFFSATYMRAVWFVAMGAVRVGPRAPADVDPVEVGGFRLVLHVPDDPERIPQGPMDHFRVFSVVFVC